MRTFAFAVVACLFFNSVVLAGAQPTPAAPQAEQTTSVEKDVATPAAKSCDCDKACCVTLFPRRSVTRSYSQGACGECTTTRTVTRYRRPRLFGWWRACSSCSSCSSCK